MENKKPILGSTVILGQLKSSINRMIENQKKINVECEDMTHDNTKYQSNQQCIEELVLDACWDKSKEN